MMSRLSVFVLLLFIGFGPPLLSQNIVQTGKRLDQEQIRTLIRESDQKIRSILARELYLPGMAVALVDRDGILWAEGYGYRDKAHTGAVDTNTIFGVLSVSKPITVTGLMMAVQDGLLDLDVPIRMYLPEFTIQTRFGGDPLSEITLRHLISMTAGLTHDAPIGNNSDASSPSYEEHIRSFMQTWMRFRTGERAEYSGLGTELAGQCLERVLHKPFTTYLQDRLFAPLGMKRSTYLFSVIRDDGNRAVGNNRNIPVLPVQIPMLAPAGVYSSVTDIARFVQFHLDKGRVQGRVLLKEELIAKMGTIPFPFDGQISGYGQGLWVRHYHLGGEEVRSLEHGGGGFGFLSQMKWLPDLGYGVVLLTNSSDQEYGHERIVEDILVRIIEQITGRKPLDASDWLARHTTPATVDTTYLPAVLTGRYNGTSEDMIFLIRNGRFGYASGNGFEPMTPVSRNEFASKRYVYRFVSGKDGIPVSVVRPYDGSVWLFSEGDATPRGPDKKEWASYTGSYVRKRFGVGEKFYNVTVRNGWLHFEGSGQDFRLAEHLPGLFFTPDGEAIDFRGPVATYRNIKLYKTCQ
jgi:CubicO group peptidase (beta-lactamase class C family)